MVECWSSYVGQLREWNVLCKESNVNMWGKWRGQAASNKRRKRGEESNKPWDQKQIP